MVYASVLAINIAPEAFGCNPSSWYIVSSWSSGNFRNSSCRSTNWVLFFAARAWICGSKRSKYFSWCFLSFFFDKPYYSYRERFLSKYPEQLQDEGCDEYNYRWNGGCPYDELPSEIVIRSHWLTHRNRGDRNGSCEHCDKRRKTAFAEFRFLLRCRSLLSLNFLNIVRMKAHHSP